MMTGKPSAKHPYAAIEHRVIDSAAYADLSFSARSLLVIIARQLSKNNNGHLMATYSYLRKFGFESENTISRCIRELITHGMIYRTRSGGYQQGAAKYAVTWLSITDKKDLFLDGFVHCAWRHWNNEEKGNQKKGITPCKKKSPPPKMQYPNCKKGIWTNPPTAKNAVSTPPKSADIELMPIGVSLSTHAVHPESIKATASIYRLPLIAGGRMQPIKNYA